MPPVARTALRLFTLAALIAAAPALHASSITYDVTLSPVSGTYAGSGTITLASAPPSSGTVVYSIANQQLQNLTFSINNQDFYLSADPLATVQFTDGQLTAINFLQTVNSAPDRYTLSLSNGFTLYGNGFGHALSAGNFAATPEVALPNTTPDSNSSNPTPTTSPTPEPRSLLLLATALVGGAFLVFRRKRTAHS